MSFGATRDMFRWPAGKTTLFWLSGGHGARVSSSLLCFVRACVVLVLPLLALTSRLRSQCGIRFNSCTRRRVVRVSLPVRSSSFVGGILDNLSVGKTCQFTASVKFFLPD